MIMSRNNFQTSGTYSTGKYQLQGETRHLSFGPTNVTASNGNNQNQPNYQNPFNSNTTGMNRTPTTYTGLDGLRSMQYIPSEGTHLVNYSVSTFQETDPAGKHIVCKIQSISAMKDFDKYTFEELRYADYKRGAPRNTYKDITNYLVSSTNNTINNGFVNRINNGVNGIATGYGNTNNMNYQNSTYGYTFNSTNQVTNNLGSNSIKPNVYNPFNNNQQVNQVNTFNNNQQVNQTNPFNNNQPVNQIDPFNNNQLISQVNAINNNQQPINQGLQTFNNNQPVNQTNIFNNNQPINQMNPFINQQTNQNTNPCNNQGTTNQQGTNPFNNNQPLINTFNNQNTNMVNNTFNNSNQQNNPFGYQTNSNQFNVANQQQPNQGAFQVNTDTFQHQGFKPFESANNNSTNKFNLQNVMPTTSNVSFGTSNNFFKPATNMQNGANMSFIKPGTNNFTFSNPSRQFTVEDANIQKLQQIIQNSMKDPLGLFAKIDELKSKTEVNESKLQLQETMKALENKHNYVNTSIPEYKYETINNSYTTELKPKQLNFETATVKKSIMPSPSNMDNMNFTPRESGFDSIFISSRKNEKNTKTPKSNRKYSEYFSSEECRKRSLEMMKRANISGIPKHKGLEIIEEETPKRINLADPTIFKFKINITSPFHKEYIVNISKNNKGKNLRRALYEEIMDDNNININKNFDIKHLIIQTNVNFIQDEDILRESEFLNNDRPLYATINIDIPKHNDFEMVISEEVYEKEIDISRVSIHADVPLCSEFKTLPDQLQMGLLGQNELERIKDFTVYNSFGRLVFPGETDVAGVNLDEIIKLEPCLVSIYHGVHIPPREQKLNKRVMIELYDVFPEAIENVDDYSEFIRELRKRIQNSGEDAEFLDYNVETGTLKFSVEFFKNK
jgi:hypothetical protein